MSSQPKLKITDVMVAFAEFREAIEQKRPPMGDIHTEVRMMDYHIVPLVGSVTEANMAEDGFVTGLWKLGKLEEFYVKLAPRVARKEKETLNTLVDKLKNDILSTLSRQQIVSGKNNQTPISFELHLLRGKGLSKN